jgi:hypothetical protein
MQDLSELARQRFLAQYGVTNGHLGVEVLPSKTRRKSARVNNCDKCGMAFQNGIRHRVRVETQKSGRKWTATGLDVFYACNGCWFTAINLLEGGY